MTIYQVNLGLLNMDIKMTVVYIAFVFQWHIFHVMNVNNVDGNVRCLQCVLTIRKCLLICRQHWQL